MSPEWCIEDWLHSIKDQIGIVQYLSDKALEAMKEFFQALWPEKAILESAVIWRPCPPTPRSG